MKRGMDAVLAAMGFLLFSARGNAAVEQVAVAPEPSPSEVTICQAQLRFGLTPNAIPSECHAYLVDTRATDTDRNEKWAYPGGYLIFNQGALILIQRSRR